MIIQEQYISDWAEQPLVRTYSDKGMYVIQDGTGIRYAEAIDVPNMHTYTESNIPIPVEISVGER